MHRVFVLAALVVFGAVTESFGQQAAPAPAGQDTTGQIEASVPQVRETVVVTATRTEADIAKTPLSATVVTQQDIEMRPVQNVDQQLTMTEGIYVQRLQGFSATDSNVHLRGFGSSSRTLVLVDGQPVNDAYSNFVNWTGLPTSQVESIEVARGPFSSLYGGNALGGVISIRTRPIDRRSINGTAEYGTYNSHRVTGQYADRYRNRFGLSIGAEEFATDGYNSRRFTATPSTGTGTGTLVTGPTATTSTAGAGVFMIGEGGRNWLDRSAARIKGEYQASPVTIVSLQYLRMDYEYGYKGYNSYLRDAAGNLVDSGAVVFNDGGTLRRLAITPNNFLQGPGEQHSNFYSGTFQHAFTRGTLRVDGGWYHIPSSQFRSAGGGNTETSGPGTVSDGRRQTGHANVQYNRTTDRHIVTIGGESRHEQAAARTFQLTNWADKDTRGRQSYQASGSAVSQSAYVQDQIALASNTTLIVGGRYDFWKGYSGLSDSFNATAPRTTYPGFTANQVSGKAALGYVLPGDWNLRVSVGNAFRNPNVFELYSTSATSAGVILASNPSLMPETTVSWEVGFRKRFGRLTSVDAVYYENHIEDLIYRQTDLARDPSGNFRINVNAGRGRTRGIETSFRQELGAGLQFRGTYTYTDAIITENAANPLIVGKRVTSIPNHMASAQILGAVGKWTGSLNGHYTGLLYNVDTNADAVKGVPGSYSPYFAADASLSYQLTPNIQPFVSSENLFNRRYYIFYLSPGRTVFGGARVRL
jgi:iron complex outermembrane recepter protein